ncbi:hypothetical protein FSP39_022900 [Pinctada imbricata]|uniref:Translation initiation factor eIF2B subunit gamma n=1 Tax=Pinctada imbricata TaxID=66713 RepID=A0AA88XTY6_PINIB|nr:hypothetical protein FSP39_022900 [Pinctada imbricata]
MEFQPIVMAGGPGSRLSDLTVKCPKALLPIGNKPMVWYTINMLEKAGFEEAIVVVQEEHCEEIKNQLMDICAVKIRLDFFSLDDDEAGTADVLRILGEKDKIKRDILILSCDLITDVSLHNVANIHRTYDASATLLLSQLPSQYYDVPAPGVKSKKRLEKDFFGFDEKGERILFLTSEADVEESIEMKKSILRKHPCINIKTKLTDCFMYFMKKWVIDYLIEYKTISDLKGELIPHLVRKQFLKPKKSDKDLPKPDQSVIVETTKADILSFSKSEEYADEIRSMSTWIDHRGDMEDCFHCSKIRCYAYLQNEGVCLRANTLSSYSESNKQVGMGPVKRKVQKIFSALDIGKDKDVHIHPSATIKEKSQVGADCLVAEGALIGERVSIKKSVVGKHCKIEDKVKITNSVIMDHVTVKEGSNVQGSIISAHSLIGEKCDLKDCIVGNEQHVNPMGKYTNEAIVEVEKMMEI